MYITCTPGLRCPGQQQTFFLLPSHRERVRKSKAMTFPRRFLAGLGARSLDQEDFILKNYDFTTQFAVVSFKQPSPGRWSQIGWIFGGQREIGPGCWRNALWPSRFLGWFLGLQSWLSVQSIASHQPLRGNCWWWLNWGSPTPFKRCDYSTKLIDMFLGSHVLRRTHIGIRFWWV